MAMVAVHDDMFTDDVIADPYTYYGRLREEDPVHWNEKYELWVITRHDDVVCHLPPIGLRQEDLNGVTGGDTENKNHDHLLKSTKTVQLGGQNEEDQHAGEQRRRQHREMKEEVKAQRGAEKLGQVGCQGR